LATNSVVISRVSFSSGDIESVANQLRAILSAQVSTNYVVSLNCDLPKIVIPNSVTVLAPPELHREFRRIVYRLEHGEDSGPATTNGTERIRAQNLIRPYECDFGFTNCYFAIGNDFHVVATNTLAMMERIVAAQCLLAEAVGVLSSDYSSNRLQIGVEYLPDRDALRRDIRSVLMCDDDEVADRIGVLRDTMLSYEKQARYMVGDGHILKPKVHQEACQNDVIQTNGLMNCNLDGGLVDLGGNSLWNFDSWDALGTTVVDSQIAYSTRDDLREIPTAEFANPNLNLIFVALPGFVCDFLCRELCRELCRPHIHRTGSAFLG
jgi:hypothetical protein